MLSVSSRFSTMSGTAIENPQVEEEILEDGEIEDEDESDVEEEVVTVEETQEPMVLTEKNNLESGTDQPKDASVTGQEAYYGYGDAVTTKPSNHLSGGMKNENDENDINEDYDASSMSPEERKKHHKKHQRKRRRHKESKERESRSLEKKERRRKRKMNHAEDELDTDVVHGGSTSPHSKKRRKRKKHSRDHKERDSTTPDSTVSEDHTKSSSHRHNPRYYDEGDEQDYEDDYTGQEDMYGAQYPYTNTSNNNSSSYYATGQDNYPNEGNYDYDSESESGSDFEAQLAEYKNYKTQKSHVDENDDYHSVGDRKPRKVGQFSSPSGLRRSQSRRRGNMDGQKMRRTRWEAKSHSSKYSEERETSSSRRRNNDEDQQYDDYEEYEAPRRACKFFAEGICAKGNDCTFSHDLDVQSTHSYRSLGKYNQGHSRPKRKELCKYYLAGHCHHGDHCTYMHGEYPCKYHHSGATCYSGENCRFSHAPATDETREIIESFLDVYNSIDDSWEINELAKVGMTALNKPPPGVGLLPTPAMPPNSAANSQTASIPSLFDIQVEPTADLQRRIDENSVTSLSMTDEDDLPEVGQEVQQGSSHYPPTSTIFPNINMTINKQGLLPTPVGIVPNPAAQEDKKSAGDGFYDNFYEGDYVLNQSDVEKVTNKDKKKMSTDDEFIKTDDEDFIRIDTGHSADEEKQPDVKAPDFLPATQKALFMRIHQKRLSQEKGETDSSKSKKEKESEGWTYSSDDEEKEPSSVPGVIKIDSDVPMVTTASASSVESILKMITSKKGDNTATVDTNLLSKVASVINMSTAPASSSAESSSSYNPAATSATYSPAQVKASPRHSSSSQSSTSHPNAHHHHHRDRKSSGSSSTSPGHPSQSKHHTHPVRRRLSTQELSKEPVVIPLVSKQSGGLVHSAHPDPRLTLSRLLGMKVSRYSAHLPRFSKDLILPGPGKMVGLKITVSAEDAKSSKRDPRLGRHKDPRLQKSTDPRLKSRSMAKSTTATSNTDTTSPRTSSIPPKPSALITKSTTVIPSLPELNLDLAHINQMKDNSNDKTPTSTSPPHKAATSYSMPQLKLPRLMKAPTAAASPDRKPSASPVHETPSTAPPTIAPYDPRYMASGSSSTPAPSLTMNPAPYDPRVLSGQSALPTGEFKKRTIQLPKLTPAPTYKPSTHEDANDVTNGHAPDEEKPEGDQGDF